MSPAISELRIARQPAPRAIRTAFAVDATADRHWLQGACAAESGISISGFVPARCDSVHVLREYPHDALVVACAGPSDDVLGFIAAAAEQQPARPLVVLYEGIANGFVRHAFDAGADDFVQGAVNGPDGTEESVGRAIAFAIEKAVARRSGAQGLANGAGGGSERHLARMVCVVGAKGGTGKTLTACNLAAALAEAGQRVVLVDLDLQFGDVGLAMGLAPERTLYELATSAGSLDEEKVADYLTTHGSGVRVLLAPRRPDQAGVIAVDYLRELFDALRRMSDHVIVDTPPGFGPEVIAAIDRSTDVCVVAALDAASLKNNKLAVETLHLMQYDRDRIKVVLNRADSRAGVTPQDVAPLLGRAPDILVPSSREITRSVNEASPIVLTNANPEARRAFRLLASAYVTAESEASATSAAELMNKRRGRIHLRRNGG